MSTHAVLLAGGSGTRFWPLSRAHKPKQFLELVTGRTLFADTYARIAPLCSADRTWVVCGRDHAEPVRAALPALPPAHLLVEPAARNTAPAIGLAAVRAVREDPDAVLLVLPSDHYIAHQDRFLSALQTAARVAQQGDLVTLGIRPTRPETGYGYLRRGAEREPGVFAVEAFVEKPDAKTAQKYLEDPRYSWNAGIFVFRADALLEALRRHLPAVHDGLRQIGADPARTAEAFPRLPAISLDYGVLEPESSSTRRIALVAAPDLGWSDVGSFATLPEVRQLDERGNALSGDALAIDCADSVVLAEGGRLVAALGLEGLCVVDSG
ncbi:MAG TPA: mannose-1-phosphate guanylyltransferase, partial [Myxococcales bacterium]|nr:mannose-1-phosphate guanylyltransferase [Myxococcales bacterium]